MLSYKLFKKAINWQSTEILWAIHLSPVVALGYGSIRMSSLWVVHVFVLVAIEHLSSLSSFSSSPMVSCILGLSQGTWRKRLRMRARSRWFVTMQLARLSVWIWQFPDAYFTEENTFKVVQIDLNTKKQTMIIDNIY